MKTWGFGIIGSGGIGAFHRSAIQELKNARLIAVSSRSEARVKTFAEGGDYSWTIDYHELIRNPEIDILCVTTSSGSHFEIGMEVLRGGKHLVMEKPITIQAHEAQQMIDMAASMKVTLCVISQRRFEPHCALVKRLVDDGKLGKLLLIEAGTPYFRSQAYYDSADWRGTIAEDGGALMNQGIHQIDIVLWLGGPVHSVYGKTATLTHKMEAEDLGISILQFTNGTLGTIMSSTCIKPGFPAFIHVYGEKGTIKIEGQSIVYWSVEGVEAPQALHTELSDSSSNPLSITHIYHKNQLEDLLRTMELGLPPSVSGKDGKNAVELVQSICASSASGKEIILSD